MNPSLSRRQLLSAAALCAAAPVLSIRALAAGVPEQTWAGYATATVIDALGEPGRPNGKADPALDAKDLADVRRSGVNAVNLTVGGVGSISRDYDETVRSIAFWDAQIAAHPDALLKFTRMSDIEHAKQSNRLAVIYGFQDTTSLVDDIERLDTFHRLGVQIIQLTYNRRNLVGDGCLEPGNAGLSRFGHDVVDRMNAGNILVDLSHCGQRTTDEAIERSKKPVAITHAGCAAVANLPRNKNDATLRKLAERGGVVGVYLMPYLRTGGQPMATDVIAHLEHALKVCGEDHVGIGTDGTIGALDVTPEFKKSFADEIADRRRRGISAPGETPDVYTYVPDLNTPRRFEQLAFLLAKRGHSDDVIGKVIGGNFKRLFGETWA